MLAITGGTGFVGSHLLDAAVRIGVRIRALTRRAQEPKPGVEWIAGALDTPDSLAELCRGVYAIIHVAGAINAPDRAGFDRVNVDGTAAMLEAAREAGVTRFLQLSSLSAREPGLSHYGASKAAADALVARSDLRWTILRPPAVYGPGDRATLPLFQLAARGWAFLPGRGRFSLVHVRDLAAALLALVPAPASVGRSYEIDDGTPGGLGHADMARLIGEGVGRAPRLVRLPASALRWGATVETALARLAGRPPRLSHDRARYLAHPNWVADSRALLALGVWRPAIPASEGVPATARWYAEQGWL